MSDFILIVPEGFVELHDAGEWLRATGEDYIRGLIESEDWSALSQSLEDSGVIGTNAQISYARIIDTADGPRMWYKP